MRRGCCSNIRVIHGQKSRSTLPAYRKFTQFMVDHRGSKIYVANHTEYNRNRSSYLYRRIDGNWAVKMFNNCCILYQYNLNWLTV